MKVKLPSPAPLLPLLLIALTSSAQAQIPQTQTPQAVKQPALQQHIAELFKNSALKDASQYQCQRNYRSVKLPSNRYGTINHYRAQLERTLQADPTTPRYRMTYNKTSMSAIVFKGWYTSFHYAGVQQGALQAYSCILVKS